MKSSLLMFAPLAGFASAICGGFNWAIGNEQDGIKRCKSALKASDVSFV